MSYESNPLTALARLLTNLANELARMRNQFGASHEQIEQVVRDEGQRQQQATAAVWSYTDERLDLIEKQLDTIQSQLAYGFRTDFDREG